MSTFFYFSFPDNFPRFPIGDRKSDGDIFSQSIHINKVIGSDPRGGDAPQLRQVAVRNALRLPAAVYALFLVATAAICRRSAEPRICSRGFRRKFIDAALLAPPFALPRGVVGRCILLPAVVTDTNNEPLPRPLPADKCYACGAGGEGR